jgi:uncharacterized protein (TIGR00375 family)
VFIADLHIHSRYSRATSKDMNIENLSRWAKIKGIDLVGTGDFTHPLWFNEIKRKLKEEGNGLFSYQGTKFVLTSEISNIYSQGGRVRKIHTLIFSPSFEIVAKINQKLGRLGNLLSDGRPILGFSTKQLADIVFSVSKDCFIVPAHAWTPHFSVFGSNSGFDSLEEAFGEYAGQIKAIETGLSSDPAMNWRVSALDKVSLISCSDAHSPSKLGREACVFDCKIDYFEMIKAITSKDPEKFKFTVEFYPEEGKYHFDGHRNCNVVMSPEETKKHKGICPACKKRVTIGVMNRVHQLADRPKDFTPDKVIPYKNLIPLIEIIADALGKTQTSKAVTEEYFKLTSKFGSEFNILLDLSKDELLSKLPSDIGRKVVNVREGKVSLSPGYDGEYGKIKVLDDVEQKVQIGLF